MIWNDAMIRFRVALGVIALSIAALAHGEAHAKEPPTLGDKAAVIASEFSDCLDLMSRPGLRRAAGKETAEQGAKRALKNRKDDMRFARKAASGVEPFSRMIKSFVSGVNAGYDQERYISRKVAGESVEKWEGFEQHALDLKDAYDASLVVTEPIDDCNNFMHRADRFKP